MKAGKLRHRITIEQLTNTQDPATGEIAESWTVFAADVPAQVRPLSGREILAADAAQSGTRVEFVIRYGNSVGVTSAMRVSHEGAKHNITEIVPDETLRDHVKLMAEAGIRG